MEDLASETYDEEEEKEEKEEEEEPGCNGRFSSRIFALHCGRSVWRVAKKP